MVPVTIIQRDLKRGPAAEQGNVMTDRKSSPSGYWYARRISRCQSEIRKAIEKSMSRVSIGERDQLMVKIDLASGESAEETPGIKQEQKKKFLKNLLHKRKTYVSYFNASLPKVDSALRRVQAYRAWGIARELHDYDRVIASRGPRNDPVFAPGVWRFSTVLKGKISLKECGRKEKKLLKEYATRVRDRCVSKASRLNSRLAASQAKRAERERRRAVEENDRVVDLIRLRATVVVAVSSPRAVLAICSSHMTKECEKCWDHRQITLAKEVISTGINYLPFLQQKQAQAALIDKTLKEWQGSPPA